MEQGGDLDWSLPTQYLLKLVAVRAEDGNFVRVLGANAKETVTVGARHNGDPPIVRKEVDGLGAFLDARVIVERKVGEVHGRSE